MQVRFTHVLQAMSVAEVQREGDVDAFSGSFALHPPDIWMHTSPIGLKERAARPRLAGWLAARRQQTRGKARLEEEGSRAASMPPCNRTAADPF